MPDPSDIATAVQQLVAERWGPDRTVREWWHDLAASGLSQPAWPDGLGGRRLHPGAAHAVGRALAGARVLGPPTGVGQTMGGPTVIAHGTDEQRARLLPPLADGTEAWCQLFSEPGFGSDLAGLATSAVRDGGQWVVNGQKVWSSGAHLADRGLLLARTRRSVPKHEGISYFVIDMDQPGVEVRPLRQMNGESEFCEVFLTDALVADADRIGEPDQGWAIAQTTLGFERAGVASGGARGAATVTPGVRAGNLDRTAGDVLASIAASPRRAVSGFVVGNRSLAELAADRGRSSDPIARQQLARFKSMTEVNRFNGLRARAAAAAGQRPGAETSVGKLAMSNIAKASRDATFDLLGPYALLADDDAPRGGAYGSVALASFGAGFGGGTDEIQRNVIGERNLGLPKEPSIDRDIPYDEIPGGRDRKDP